MKQPVAAEKKDVANVPEVEMVPAQRKITTQSAHATPTSGASIVKASVFALAVQIALLMA